MKARFMIEDPDKIEATMKVTMRLEDWVKLRDALPSGGYPFVNLGNAITEVITDARRVYYPKSELEGGS